MHRFFTLIKFELKKILNRKKAFLFLAALNIIPLIASLILLIVYIRFRGFGFEEMQFSVMHEIVQALFTWHVKLFSYIAPFFLALVVADSFSTEFNRGHMKMLLLTPVRRWQIITAKTISIMIFLLIAVCIGGFFLQADLLIARALAENITIPEGESIYLVNTSSAMQILAMIFVGNLMLIGFFVMFSLFFESAILMSFSSLMVLMGVHSYYFIGSEILSHIQHIDNWHVRMMDWCFTRHLSKLFEVDIIQRVLEGRAGIFSPEIYPTITATLGWAAFFFAAAVFFFSRKQILH